MHNQTIEAIHGCTSILNIENPLRGKINKQIVSHMIVKTQWNLTKPNVLFDGPQFPHAISTHIIFYPIQSCTIVHMEAYGNSLATRKPRKSHAKEMKKTPSFSLKNGLQPSLYDKDKFSITMTILSLRGSLPPNPLISLTRSSV